MDEIDRAYHRQYYAVHRLKILARKARIRWEQKHHYILKSSLLNPYGIPDDIVHQMLTINLEENEEKTCKENYENAMRQTCP